jgi:5-methyltetrahydrofolate--homocysteine methyltransferase
MARIETLFNAIISGDRATVVETVQQQVDGKGDVKALLLESMIPAMREIGDRFSRNEAYVPEMLIAARAMQSGLDIIEPLLASAGHKSPAKVCVGTVKGDLHDIGKNLVAMMVKGAGFEVQDLGVDCGVDAFVTAVDNGAQVVMLSALLTTTMPYMKEVIAGLEGRSVKVLVGGAPVTQEYADSIGADGYASDANTAVKALENLVAA